MVNAMKRFSINYRFTFFPNCLVSEYNLNNLKESVREHNKAFGTKYYIVKRGRLGKGNASKKDHTANYNFQNILHKDAVRFDVYVYSR